MPQKKIQQKVRRKDKGGVKMNEEYYQREIIKLFAILNQDEKEIMIAKSYVIEKLNMIMQEVGIGIHPSLIPVVMQEFKKFIEAKK